MPEFSHLRSDYPLNLTLGEHARACPSTWFYIAGLTPRTILTSPLRHHDPVLISFYPRSCANPNSSVFAALTNKSTCGLTPAHASVRVSQLHIDEQLTTSSNVDVHIRAWQHSTQNLMVAGFVVVAHRCRVSFVGFRFRMVTDRSSAVGCVALCRAVRGHRSKSSQIRRNT
jgi:hypothetical protein